MASRADPGRDTLSTVFRRRVRRVARIPAGWAAAAASRARPAAAHLPAWERTALDDLAARRPWNLRVKWARQRALRHLDDLADGVTVVIVSWNTKDVTGDVIRAVQELSPTDVKVLVVDNGSRDGTADLLRSWRGIDTLLLRSNAGHGVALDLGVCSVRTTIAVTLDSDAIPLHPGWLEPAVSPVRDRGAILAGLRSSRDFVHPVYAAVDTAAFVRRRMSFQTFVPPGVTPATAVWGENAWDTAELLTGRLDPQEVAFVDPTPNPAPGLPGMTAGAAVYHHGGVSRGTSGTVRTDALESWRQACAAVRAAVGPSEAPGSEPG